MGEPDEILVAMDALERYTCAEEEQAAAVLMPPDSGEFIVGNEAGFVRLAIAALKAAKGAEQRFKGEAWIGEAELDWGIAGLKPDAEAHLHLADYPSMHRQSLLERLRGYALLAAILTPFVVGFVSIVLWVEAGVGHMLRR